MKHSLRRTRTRAGSPSAPISVRPCHVHRWQEEFFGPCKLSLQVMQQRGPHHGTAFPHRSPKRPINVPADGPAYGSQTPRVVLRNSHSINAGAACQRMERVPIGKGRAMTDRRESASVVGMPMATFGLAAGGSYRRRHAFLVAGSARRISRGSVDNLWRASSRFE